MEINSAASQKLDFMNLLVTELRNQNPLEPLDNQQMAAQLAQFSQLEQSEEMNTNIENMNSTMSAMNSSFQGAMAVAQLDYAKSLLGKEVSFYSGDFDQHISGTVESIAVSGTTPTLRVNGSATNPDGSQHTGLFGVGVNEILGIKN